MKVIAVATHKGGEGKTTISRLLMEYAGRLGLRVCGIDIDSQCSLSKRFLQMDDAPDDPDGSIPPMHPAYDSNDPDCQGWSGRSSVAGMFNGDIIEPYPTRYPNVSIIPGHGSEMRRIESVRQEDVREKVVERIRLVLHDDAASDLFDLVVIDTPPSKNPLVQAAIRAATHLLIPLQLEQQSIEGVNGMLQLLRRENRFRTEDSRLELLGFLPNKTRNVGLHKGIMDSLKRDDLVAPHLLSCSLAQRTAFAEADHPNASPVSVFDLPPGDKAREEATTMCETILTMTGLINTDQEVRHVE